MLPSPFQTIWTRTVQCPSPWGKALPPLPDHLCRDCLVCLPLRKGAFLPPLDLLDVATKHSPWRKTPHSLLDPLEDGHYYATISLVRRGNFMSTLPGHYHPQSLVDASFPSPLFHTFSYSGKRPSHSCASSYELPSFPPPYDMPDLPHPVMTPTISLLLGIGNWFLFWQPRVSESDTDSVASPYPSKSAYDASSRSKVPCMVPLPPNLGKRPH